jgi:Rieske Fe-S protein
MDEEHSASRRQFLGYAMAGMAGAITLAYAVPIGGYIILPSLGKAEDEWSLVGDANAIASDEPVSVNFSLMARVGWEEKKVEHDIWVVKRPDDSITAYSPTCPHLGCGYRWNPSSKRFECPCHSSTFDIDGKVQGGPAPRGLDELPSKVEDGKLYVIFKKYRLGITDRVEA